MCVYVCVCVCARVRAFVCVCEYSCIDAYIFDATRKRGCAYATCPSSPENPALHVQAVRRILACGEVESAGHALQATARFAPVAFEYVPAAQSVHDDDPFKAENLPAAHGSHSRMPVTAANVPAKQSRQG